jgi:hypothetical protein
MMNMVAAVAAPVPAIARPSVWSKSLAVSHKIVVNAASPLTQYMNGQN